MFTQISERISKFAKERNWRHLHHPKNLIINIFGEFAELTEHLIAPSNLSFDDLKNDSKKFSGICEELGDLFINLIQFAGVTDISVNKCKIAPLSPELSPSQVTHRLFVTIGFLAEPLTWISEEESRSFEVTDNMPRILNEAVSIVLFFSKQLGVDPIDNAFAKLAKIEIKWPVGSTEEQVTAHHRNKAKNRNSHDKS